MRTQRWTCKFLCMDLFTFRTCEKKMWSFEYTGKFFCDFRDWYVKSGSTNFRVDYHKLTLFDN